MIYLDNVSVDTVAFGAVALAKQHEQHKDLPQVGRCMDAWVDGWMHGCMGRWMDAWMHG
jgi:hypothetical protein